MLLLTILLIWLAVSLAVLSLCVAAHVGDLHSLSQRELEDSLEFDSYVIVPFVELAEGAFDHELLYGASKPQAA